jgi:ribosomal protein S2
LEDALAKGTVETTTKRETLKVRTEIERLNRNLGGIKEIERLPDALFIIDPHREEIAVKEAHSLSIPIVAVLDTDCDPRFIDYPIPGNDDSVHSIKLISSEIASAVSEGNKIYRERRDRRLAAEEELAAMEEAARAERQQAAAARHERQQEKLDSEQESSITASEIVQSKDDSASDKVTEERKSDDENADKGHIDEKQNPLIETETQDSKGT